MLTTCHNERLRLSVRVTLKIATEEVSTKETERERRSNIYESLLRLFFLSSSSRSSL